MRTAGLEVNRANLSPYPRAPGCAAAHPVRKTVFVLRYLEDSHSRLVLMFLYDLCRKVLSEPILCPRNRAWGHLLFDN